MDESCEIQENNLLSDAWESLQHTDKTSLSFKHSTNTPLEILAKIFIYNNSRSCVQCGNCEWKPCSYYVLDGDDNCLWSPTFANLMDHHNNTLPFASGSTNSWYKTTWRCCQNDPPITLSWGTCASCSSAVGVITTWFGRLSRRRRNRRKAGLVSHSKYWERLWNLLLRDLSYSLMTRTACSNMQIRLKLPTVS